MNKQSQQLTFGQGISEEEETTVYPITSSSVRELVNWRPEPTGGLRARASWSQGSMSGTPAVSMNRGIGTFTRPTDPTVAQISAAVKTKINTNGVAATPSLSWVSPTRAGNTLLCVVAIDNNGTTGGAWTTFTPGTGWSVRVLPVSSVAQTIGVMEFANAPIQTGAQSPFTIQHPGAWGIGIVAWLVELAGVVSAPFDQTGTGAATFANSSGAQLNGSPAQASEIILAIDSSARPNPVGLISPLPYTLSTSSSGWRELVEDGQNHADNFSNALWQEAAIYAAALETPGLAPINVASSEPVNHSVRLLSFKGWNPAASPGFQSDVLLSAHDNGTSFDIYSIDSNSLAAGAYTLIDAGLGSSTGGLPVQFATGLGAVWYTHPSFSGIRRWDGQAASTVAGSPIGARCVVVHQDRLWVAGTLALPHRVQYSQALDGTVWTGAGTGFFDIASFDGEPVESMSPHTTLTMFGTLRAELMIGKKTSAWEIVGDDVASMVVFKMNAGDAAPGTSVVTTADGVIFAGRHQVWFWDGTTTTRISPPIQISYGMTGNYMAVSYIDNSAYICDEGSGKVFVFDFDSKTWRQEAVTEAVAMLFNLGGRQFYGPKSSSVASLLNYRDFPAPARTKDFDPMAQTYHLRTPDWWLAPTNRTEVVRHVTFKLRQRGGDSSDTPIRFTPYFDGIADASTTLDVQPIAGVYEQRIDLGRDAHSFGFALDQTLVSGEADNFDIEDVWCEYTVSEPRGTGR